MPKNVLIILIIAVFNIFLSVDVTKSDTLFLNNGDVISGHIVTFKDNLCIFDTNYNGSLAIGINNINRISSDNDYEITITTGEKINGKFITKPQTNENYVATTTFGVIPIAISKVNLLKKIYPAPKNVTAKNNTRTENNKVEEKKFGSDSEEEPPLDFLSGSTVLLKPLTFELDFDVNYRQSRTSYALPQAGYFQKSSYSAKQLELALGFRGGLWEGAEGWLRVPFTYGTVRDVSTNEWVRHKDQFDLGDISFGLQQMLLKENVYFPAISASLGVSAPTGEKHYRELTNTWQDPLDNGTGHWSLTPGLSFVRTVDPAVLFGGISYQYSFANNINGYWIKPGWALQGFFGVGFALNEKLSLGTRLSHAYYSEFEADGELIEGSEAEATDLSFMLSYRAWDHLVISPQVTFGLNSDAGAPNFGAKFTWRF